MAQARRAILPILLAAVTAASCGGRGATTSKPAVPPPRVVAAKAGASEGPPARAPAPVQASEQRRLPAVPPGPAAPAPAKPAPPPGRPAFREASREASGPPVRRVGILLPARGRWKGFGIEARRGAELCMEDPGGVRRLRLVPVFREEVEGEDPAAAVADLADREKAVAVIGPLLSASVARALPAAERRDLALISPTAAAEGLGEGSAVFYRTCMTMNAFASSLAEIASRRSPRPAIAILAPAERYGRSFAVAFRRALEEQGGRVPLVREYDPSLRDLAPWAAALKKELRPGASRGAGGWAVDGIFLAGTAQEAGMILPRLALQGMDPRELVVLGGSALDVPEFPRLAGGYGEGAIIADGFFPGSALPAARAFAARYRARYGVDPGVAAAQGCAAAEAVVGALGGGADGPRETLAALNGLGEFSAAIGRIQLLPGGRGVRRPFFLTVRGGSLVELEGR